jgi:hypothetical protein
VKSRCGLACVVVILAGAADVARAAPELPLGPRSLDERRSSAQLTPGVRWTRIVREGGPWRVNVLSIRPGARVTVTPGGDAVGVRARPSILARRLAGVAAVNGGYFAADGNPAGVLASAGALVSEPVGGRTALALGAQERLLTALHFAGAVTVESEIRLLDGVNRPPGLVPACGGRGGDRPTERPDAATICTDSSELVLFSPQWGGRAPAADLHAVVRAGVVTALRRRAIPKDGFVLGATGEAARFLDDAAAIGADVQPDLGLQTPRGALADEALAGIVGGGPRLLSGGRVRVRVRAAVEGFSPLSAPWFYGSFVAARHPRTLAGVRSDGTLLLVTVDGRRPGWSAGVTLLEAARLMRALGAGDALNLDGGGSTAMTVRGRVVSRPSDPSGERPVSDALVVLP